MSSHLRDRPRFMLLFNEKVRIISAHIMTKHEMRIYEES